MDKNFSNYYERGEKLGEGQHAVVYKCTHKETGQIYAVKKVRDNDQEKIDAHKEEFKILQGINH
eukprot:CAMPEP_0116873882 /NCGR_PEP_ID=MMETSP0463-20121206/5213_1 /TAXON_ID=181622 /ORGANISM="Strombidinopsis sp, Strain SopsisLIS2011" /LENGTH=63 /DNA_ID=CAMNT_0004516709 /DNA_START=591 /DNA_END=782 /DNA_ORIENTATION=+